MQFSQQTTQKTELTQRHSDHPRSDFGLNPAEPTIVGTAPLFEDPGALEPIYQEAAGCGSFK